MDALMQAESVRSVQVWATPLLDYVFLTISFLGSLDFYLIALALLFWLGNRPLAFRLSLVALLAHLVNLYLKDYFQLPRPSPAEVRVVGNPQGFGFPSGHAQVAAAFWTDLSLEVRSGWLFLCALLAVAAIGFSRVYLGAHFPGDVLGGLAFGAAVALLVRGVYRLWRRLVVPDLLPFYLVLAMLGPLALLVWYNTPESRIAVGLLIGTATGYLLYPEEERGRRWQGGWLRSSIKAFIGLTVLFLLRSAVDELVAGGATAVAVPGYAVLGLWVTLGAPLLFRWLWT
ncbi:MAG: phosphatase PAP2 family protein [Bacillota bacterium]|nr:phosphatase PAP2 family protein [Bacillota bacterium]